MMWRNKMVWVGVAGRHFFINPLWRSVRKWFKLSFWRWNSYGTIENFRDIHILS